MIRKRAAYETLLVIIVVGLSILLGAGLYAGRQKVERGNLLGQEITAIRSAIAHYKVVNKVYPPTLEELARARFEVQDSDSGAAVQRPYIELLPRERTGGMIVDPFGKPYVYDPTVGLVSSATKGFENW